jgi:leucyl-tRNA synthetase
MSYRSQIERLYNTAIELLQKNGGKKKIDTWLVSRFYSKLKKANEAMGKFNLKAPIDLMLFEFLNDLEWYRKRGGESRETIGLVLDVWLRSLAPFIPHVCEEVWEKFGKGLVSAAQWPKADDSKINEKVELMENSVVGLESDIKKVVELAKITPKKISVFIAPEWKRTVYDKAKEIKNANLLIKEVMMDPEVKKRGQEAVTYVQYLSKHSQELLPRILSASEERGAIEDVKEYLKKQFDAEMVVENAEASSNPKAKSAVPLKPAIFVE